MLLITVAHRNRKWNKLLLNISTHLYRIRQRDGDGQRQTFRNGHDQHRHSDDEELHEVLDVYGGTVREPGVTLNDEGLYHEVQHQDNHRDGRHH